MVIEFSPAKDILNIRDHKVSLAFMGRFDLTRTVIGTAKTVKGESREWAMCEVDGRVWFAVFVKRGVAFRPISVRPASDRERERYAESIKNL